MQRRDDAEGQGKGKGEGGASVTGETECSVHGSASIMVGQGAYTCRAAPTNSGMSPPLPNSFYTDPTCLSHMAQSSLYIAIVYVGMGNRIKDHFGTCGLESGLCGS